MGLEQSLGSLVIDLIEFRLNVLLFEFGDEASVREQPVDEHRRASEIEALGVLRDRRLHDAARGCNGVGDQDDLLGARLVHLGSSQTRRP